MPAYLSLSSLCDGAGVCGCAIGVALSDLSLSESEFCATTVPVGRPDVSVVWLLAGAGTGDASAGSAEKATAATAAAINGILFIKILLRVKAQRRTCRSTEGAIYADDRKEDMSAAPKIVSKCKRLATSEPSPQLGFTSPRVGLTSGEPCVGDRHMLSRQELRYFVVLALAASRHQLSRRGAEARKPACMRITIELPT